MSPEQLAEARDLILEAIVTPDATPYGAAIRNKGRAALAELEAELARVEKDLYYQRLMHQADLDFRRETLEPRLKELEAEQERLTVGRTTLEDQANRAELAEARADVFEAALRQIAVAGYVRTGAGGFDDPASSTSDPRLEGLADIARAALVLSGGSE